MSDEETTVAELRRAMAAFVDRRDWQQYHTPKNLAMSIAIESAELMEHFQWYSAEEAAARLTEPSVRAAITEELADILMYCLSFANVTAIDMAEAIRAKMARNELRFPVERVRGKLG